MKKYASALALAAVLGAPSAAMAADISISGFVAAGVAYYDYDSDGVDGSELGLDDGRASRIRFAAVEDLGNGLKADFMMETRFTSDMGSRSALGTDTAAGNVWVGLSGGFGKVVLGRVDTYYSDGILVDVTRATSNQSIATLSLFNSAGAGAGTFVTASRHDNQIRYTSPNLGGFTATVAYGFGNQTGDEATAAQDGKSDREIYANLTYLKGPIYAGVSYLNVDVDSGLGDVDAKAYRVYGAYTLPMGLKIGLSVDHQDNDADNRTAWFVPLTYKVGNHAVYATYGQAQESDEGDDNGAKFYNIGYDYAFTNRTSIGANYTVMDNDDNGTYGLFLQGTGGSGLGPRTGSSAGMKTSQFYVGLMHVF